MLVEKVSWLSFSIFLIKNVKYSFQLPLKKLEVENCGKNVSEVFCCHYNFDHGVGCIYVGFAGFCATSN